MLQHVLVFVLVGFVAQFMGGALGMGYGITCTSMLLLAGLAPVAASTSVHATEVVTLVVVGISHWRLRNVDWGLTLRLALPGCIGAFVGAAVLTQLPMKASKPFMSALLIGLGVFVLARFLRGSAPVLQGRVARPRTRLLAPLGLGAGFVDATGGGGWGAITTSVLLGSGRVAPRLAVGSSDVAKGIVSLAALIGLLTGAGTEGLHPSIVLPLIAGGVVAGPIAAFLVTRLPARTLGILAGIAIIAINLPVAVVLAPASDRLLVALGTAVLALAIVLVTGRMTARQVRQA